MNLRLKLAIKDIVEGLRMWRIWVLLAWQDIRLRYRRSQLGPFWITISMAITIYSMGFLYGHLFKMDLHTYFPFLASGMLVWAFMTTTIIETTNAFIDASGYLKQIHLPFVVFIMRVVTRNIIIFAHNILAIIPIIIFCNVHVGWQMLTFFLGVAIIALNAVIFGFTLGILGARFRDIYQVIVSLMQIIFFLTPVMWMPRILPAKYQFIINFNPFAQFIDLIRSPLMGVVPSWNTYLVAISCTILGVILMLAIFCRARHRIVYWL